MQNIKKNMQNNKTTGIIVKSKVRKLPIKLPKVINDNFRIPRKVKKKMKKRLGKVGYNYWYCRYIRKMNIKIIMLND